MKLAIPGSRKSDSAPPQPEWKRCIEDAGGSEAFQLFCLVARRATAEIKTRRVRLIGRKCEPQIFRTFLGYEVIGARKRVLCPDLTTAKYVKLFAEIGLKEVEIPYDVTMTQEVLPELERSFSAFKRILDFFADQLLTEKEKRSFLRGAYRKLARALQDRPAPRQPVKHPV